MKLHASGEDYLEAILMLQKKSGMVRSVDLARHMGFSKPSISHAVAYHVWSEEYVENELTAIHNIMSRLRQKLKISPDIPDYIISVRGVGYKFDTTQQKK